MELGADNDKNAVTGPNGTEGPEPAVRRSFWRRNRWIWWVAGAMLVVLIATAAVLSVVARRFEPFIREQIVASLEQRFHTHVELADFHVSVHHGQESEWGLWATGRGLRIWPPTRDGKNQQLETAQQPNPLIDLGEFSFHVPLRFEMAQHPRIREVRLKSLIIDVPPRSELTRLEGFQPDASSSGGPGQLQDQQPQSGPLAGLTVDHVICDGAELKLETDKPNKVPLQFVISKLKLMHVAVGKPFEFEAVLTNPKPQGLINSSGSFGPWNVGDPGESPLSGKYHFEHADLGTFNGIAGILSSTGTYTGSLREMVVDGESDVPDFRLTSFGNPIPLHAKFHARVDGTDGDTWLEPVNATLGHSHFTTSGKVVRVYTATGEAAPRTAAKIDPIQTPRKPTAGRPVAPVPSPAPPKSNDSRTGRLIDLKVVIDRGNLEDFMGLVSHTSTPLLTGTVASNAMLHIAPGDEPVPLRMKLDGNFKLTGARFSTPKVQDRVLELSLRGQGRPDEIKTADPASIQSQMDGDFHLNHGVITLPELHYGVPGADVDVNGYYAFDGKLNFEGTARMQATVSQMLGGWKGFLAKPVDRFFRKGGSGTLVPIHVRGSRDAPEIGIDFGRMKQTSPQKPGETQK